MSAAWQCVERDLRSQAGSERGLVEEYVEKMPNPSLKGEGRGQPPRCGGSTAGAGPRGRGGCSAASAATASAAFSAAFKPVDLGDLKRRSTQDAKKS